MATVSSAYAKAILAAIQGDEDRLLALAGIDRKLLDEARVPLSATGKMWDASRLLRDKPILGFKVAETLDQGSLGIVEYICRNSSTVGEALSSLSDNINLLNDTLFCALFLGDDTARFVQWSPYSVEGFREEGVEFFFGFLLSVGRELTGGEWNPTEVHFRHEARTSPSEYEVFFGTKVIFGSAIDELRFEREKLEIALRGSDSQLKVLLSKVLLEETGVRDIQRVRAILNATLGETPTPGISDVASRLGMSERTLRRSLESQNSSFRKILDDVRKHKALEYILLHKMRANDLTELLGFSEAAAFHRAFQRWFGQSADKFRT